MHALWRNQWQKGLPEQVGEKLEDVDGLTAKPDAEWRENIIHGWRSYNQKKTAEREEMERVTAALLKLQISEKGVQQKAKKKQKLVSSSASGPDDLQTAIIKAVQAALAAQPPANQQPGSYYNMTHPTSGNNWGHRGRGGEMTGRGGFWYNKKCYGCGGTDHFMRDCPNNPQNQHWQGGHQVQTSPYRGGMMNRGGGGGGGHVPHVNQMPQSVWPQDDYQPQTNWRGLESGAGQLTSPSTVTCTITGEEDELVCWSSSSSVDTRLVPFLSWQLSLLSERRQVWRRKKSVNENKYTD